MIVCHIVILDAFIQIRMPGNDCVLCQDQELSAVYIVYIYG